MSDEKRTIKLTLTDVPFTVNVKAPIPDRFGGGAIPYSNWFVGLTGATLTVNQEIDVEVEPSGSDLVDVGEAVKTVVSHFFAVNQEIAREAWQVSKDISDIYQDKESGGVE